MKLKNIFPFILPFLLLLACCSACKKFVQVDAPKTQLVSLNVFENDATAISTMRGVFSRMMSSSGYASGGMQSITTLTGLSSDELFNYAVSGENDMFYVNALSPNSNGITSYMWSEPYNYIYTVNSVIAGLDRSTTISNQTRTQIIGEAKFIRAFCNFYLVNLFGDIPLDTVIDYHITGAASRTSSEKVYRQIITDLVEAYNKLPASYENTERVLPTKWAASALLARVYLYVGDWVKAEASATELINNTGLFELLSDPSQVFLKNSRETIWQLKPVMPGINTLEGFYNTLTTEPTNTSLSDSLVRSFESGDRRRTAWVGAFHSGSTTYYFPSKYKVVSDNSLTEYSMVIRLAEIYLIRAEARAHQNNVLDAQADVNTIRVRAGLPNTAANTPASLLLAIEQERNMELFTEWGHRWLDLKRTGRVNAVIGAIKGSNWQPTDALYPIPFTELQNNRAMTQNPGY